MKAKVGELKTVLANELEPGDLVRPASRWSGSCCLVVSDRSQRVLLMLDGPHPFHFAPAGEAEGHLILARRAELLLELELGSSVAAEPMIPGNLIVSREGPLLCAKSRDGGFRSMSPVSLNSGELTGWDSAYQAGVVFDSWSLVKLDPAGGIDTLFSYSGSAPEA